MLQYKYSRIYIPSDCEGSNFFCYQDQQQGIEMEGCPSSYGTMYPVTYPLSKNQVYLISGVSNPTASASVTFTKSDLQVLLMIFAAMPFSFLTERLWKEHLMVLVCKPLGSCEMLTRFPSGSKVT